MGARLLNPFNKAWLAISAARFARGTVGYPTLQAKNEAAQRAAGFVLPELRLA
jgi:hypothetical protein